MLPNCFYYSFHYQNVLLLCDPPLASLDVEAAPVLGDRTPPPPPDPQLNITFLAQVIRDYMSDLTYMLDMCCNDTLSDLTDVCCNATLLEVTKLPENDPILEDPDLTSNTSMSTDSTAAPPVSISSTTTTPVETSSAATTGPQPSSEPPPTIAPPRICKSDLISHALFFSFFLLFWLASLFFITDFLLYIFGSHVYCM